MNRLVFSTSPFPTKKNNQEQIIEMGNKTHELQMRRLSYQINISSSQLAKLNVLYITIS